MLYNSKSYRIWDERSNKAPVKIIKAHGKLVSDMKFNPSNEKLFLSVRMKGFIMI